MLLIDIPIGAEVKVLHRYLVSEVGYSSWETEVITGIVHKHCNEAVTLLRCGNELISCNNHKDKVLE